MISQEGFEWPRIFLPNIARNAQCSIYVPHRFSGVQLWFENSQVDVFENGIINLKSRSEKDLSESLEKICNLVSRVENVKVQVESLVIHQIIANGQLPFRIRQEMNESIDGVTFRVYESGKFTIWCEEFHQVSGIFNSMCVYFRQYQI